MAEDNGEGADEQQEAAGEQLVVHRADDTAHDARQADDTAARHQRLEDREGGTVRIPVVEQAADTHGQDGHDEDVEEHAHGVYLDNLARRHL